jgi:hypothetical protein
MEFGGSRSPAVLSAALRGRSGQGRGGGWGEEGPSSQRPAVRSPTAPRAAIVARASGLGVALVFGYHVPRPALFDVVFDVRLHSTIRIYTYSSHPCTYLSRYPVICFVFCLRVLLVPAPAPVPVTLAASMSSAAQQAPGPDLASFGHSNPGVGGYTYPSTAAVSFSQPGARDVD